MLPIKNKGTLRSKALIFDCQQSKRGINAFGGKKGVETCEKDRQKNDLVVNLN